MLFCIRLPSIELTLDSGLDVLCGAVTLLSIHVSIHNNATFTEENAVNQNKERGSGSIVLKLSSTLRVYEQHSDTARRCTQQ